MRLIGYSTGAIALGDFAEALDLLKSYSFQAVELSALRINEVQPLIEALPRLGLSGYTYISFHAPSTFREDEEESLISLLMGLPESWPIVLHPDAIHSVGRWKPISHRLAIENMDRRKGTGRSAAELLNFFQYFPDAKMCLDLGHARQIDPSMIEAYKLLTTYKDRIVQLHVSEVDTFNRHDVISFAAEIAFVKLSRFIPEDVAVILESRVSRDQIGREASKVLEMLSKTEEMILS